ncbi:hypothetical protein D3C81_1728350 [compost metagenome]
MVCCTSLVICSIIWLKLKPSWPISSRLVKRVRTVRFPRSPCCIRFRRLISGRPTIQATKKPVATAKAMATSTIIMVRFQIFSASFTRSSTGTAVATVQGETLSFLKMVSLSSMVRLAAVSVPSF